MSGAACRVRVADVMSKPQLISETLSIGNALKTLQRSGLSVTMLSRDRVNLEQYVRDDELSGFKDKDRLVSYVSHPLERRHRIDIESDVLSMLPRLSENLRFGEAFLACYNKDRVVGIVTISDINTEEFAIAIYPRIAKLENLSRRFIVSKFKNWEDQMERVLPVGYRIACSNYRRAVVTDTEMSLEYYLRLEDKLSFLYQVGKTGLFPKTATNIPTFIRHLTSLRNSIAHPCDILRNGRRGVALLHETIEGMYTLIDGFTNSLST